MDARKYEESLKAELTNWIKNGNVEEVISTHIFGEVPSPLCFLELFCSVITIFWVFHL